MFWGRNSRNSRNKPNFSIACAVPTLFRPNPKSEQISVLIHTMFRLCSDIVPTLFRLVIRYSGHLNIVISVICKHFIFLFRLFRPLLKNSAVKRLRCTPCRRTPQSTSRCFSTARRHGEGSQPMAGRPFPSDRGNPRAAAFHR